MNGGQIECVPDALKKRDDRIASLEEALRIVRTFINDWGPEETPFLCAMTNDHLAIIDVALRGDDDDGSFFRGKDC